MKQIVPARVGTESSELPEFDANGNLVLEERSQPRSLMDQHHDYGTFGSTGYAATDYDRIQTMPQRQKLTKTIAVV